MNDNNELNLTTHRASASVWDRRGWDGTRERLAMTLGDSAALRVDSAPGSTTVRLSIRPSSGQRATSIELRAPSTK